MKLSRLLAVIVLALLACLFLVSPADAGCRSRVVVKEAVVVEKVVPVLTTLAVAAVPLYQAYAQPAYIPSVPYGVPGYSYGAPGVPNAAGVDPSINERLERLEKAMQQVVDAINRGPGVQPSVPPMPPAQDAPKRGAAVPGNHPGLLALQTNCASCHSRTAAPSMGGSFVLLEPTGQLAPLTDRQRLNVILRIDSDDEKKRMPKGKPFLEDADANAVKNFIGSTLAGK